jgi:pSer/pThr/pTyr-binding forkhead associated (FHA) protein
MTGIVYLAVRLALAAGLFAFLIYVLILLRRDLRLEEQRLAVLRPPVLLLHPLRPEGAAARFVSAEIAVGRDPANDLSLDDRTVSARHARLSFHDGQWWVEDLRSTNGTYLNLEPVDSPVVVTHNDILRFGQVEMRLELGTPDSQPSSK